MGSKRLVSGVIGYLMRMRMLNLNRDQFNIEISRKAVQMGLRVSDILDCEQTIHEMVQLFNQKQNGCTDIANIMYY